MNQLLAGFLSALGLTEHLRLGEELRANLPSEIRGIEENDSDPTVIAEIRDGAEKYIKSSSRLALRFGGLLLIPFLFLTPLLIRGEHHNIVYRCYFAWVIFLGIAATLLFSPLAAIIPHLRKLPEPVYRDLLRPILWNLEIFFVLTSIVLFSYIYPSWNLSATIPIWGLIVFLWIFAPWTLYLRKRDHAFIKLRIIQFGTLILASLVTVISPVPMTHFEWWAQKELANRIRPVEQIDITTNWETLKWFTQEGAPNVWYSVDENHGYRLYNCAGVDPETKVALQPVDSPIVKDQIVERLRRAERAERILRDTESRKEQISNYVTAGHRTVRTKNAVIFYLDGSPDRDSAEWLSKVFSRIDIVADPGVFSDAFAASVGRRHLKSGVSPGVRLFDPSAFCERLIICEANVSYGKIENPVEMITADLVLTIQISSPSDGQVLRSIPISARGIGFKRADALKLAYGRAEDQLIARAQDFVRLQ